jgi:hypothetical protein
MESHLISRKRDIETELRLMNYGSLPNNKARKLVLERTLLGIERDIKSIGFNEDEIAKNDFAVGGKEVKSNSFLVDPTGSLGSPKDSKNSQVTPVSSGDPYGTGGRTVRELRAIRDAEYAAREASNKYNANYKEQKEAK